ncbi:MAG: UDP-glucose 4-epimerase [Paenibacillaceae bacterium]|jgi:UDP-glucose 4-epimerase|nr:UDP-glucose 4-epimerase [Paenibacillaceae bacterium]
MKAVVTGGAGFIGTHLVQALLAGRHEVHVIDDLSTGAAAKVHPGACLHVQDIRTAQAADVIRTVRPDAVFHLAAQADVQRSIKESDADAAINIAGTANILEACRLAEVGKLVFSSTSAVYGELHKEIIDEDDPAAPISFYGLSKKCAESYIRLYGRLYGLPYTILRYANVYGPGQTAKGEGGVIALFMERLASGQTLHIHGDGEQTRDFIYVMDVVRANLAAVGQGDRQTLHVSTGRKTSVNGIAGLLREFHGGNVDVQYGPARLGDIKHSCLNNKKITEQLQWQPKNDIRGGLEQTYQYWMNSSG